MRIGRGQQARVSRALAEQQGCLAAVACTRRLATVPASHCTPHTHLAGIAAAVVCAVKGLVAGAAAVYLTNHPGSSPAAVGTALVNGATSNVLTGVGTGSPNKLLRLVP